MESNDDSGSDVCTFLLALIWGIIVAAVTYGLLVGGFRAIVALTAAVQGV